MTVAFRKGRYGVRLAAGPADVAACQALRHRCFYGCEGIDADHFDDSTEHVMLAGDAGLVATFRMRVMPASLIQGSYAGQFYDLTRLTDFHTPVMEIGRFCIAGRLPDPDVVRIAWGAVARSVINHGVGLIFGCSSFSGVLSDPYGATFARLRQAYLAPDRWAPEKSAHEVVPFSAVCNNSGRAPMPPLLRSYLAMGGWVSDHAVIDRTLQTMHVFTGLEVAAIPPSRVRALMAVAG